ncbi:MAG TPA: hypothetical protein PLG34_10835 [Spirochaetota bacterium]|jgi:hypothetical protein|nr:MAG: hypothetical protein BWX91_01654 [Spirochaetes bacterium ADurb.Bin133]HNZ27295.1 hypothetical protein [Spirochaetota bacterium]HPY88463.1 hypothetical protein [Spirochaetota bacterium]HQB61715.1 hypothetical protein [Spirochaetota bacterium]
MKELSSSEINLAVRKIKSKYEDIIKEFKKSRVLLENFEDRYAKTLRSKMDLSTFLLAEIEAVTELYKREEIKRSIESIEVVDKKDKKTVDKKSFADKVYEENLKKIQNYPRISLHRDASEEIERLLGAVRTLINDYWPAITLIFRDNKYYSNNDKFSAYYHKLLTNYDYTGIMPISRQYIDALNRKPQDMKKIDFENRFILQETAFLLNDILDALNKVLDSDGVYLADKKIAVKAIKCVDGSNFQTIFKGLLHTDCVKKVRDYTEEIINDFRIKGIKRNY